MTSRTALCNVLICGLIFGAMLPRPVEPASPGPDAIPIKIMTIVAVSDIDAPDGDYGEARLWVEHESLNRRMSIPGVASPLAYNDAGHCLIVTDVGPANAAASLMAVGLSDRLDLRNTYFLVAGSAGTPPNVATLGSAAWAEWIVDADLNQEIDIRELPSNWKHPRSRMWCDEPWCENWRAGHEVYHLNAQLTEWAFRLSRDVELFDSEAIREYRGRYPEGTPARRPPFVLKADVLATATYRHGKLASDWADWWVKQWTAGAGTYGMTCSEDCGTMTALTRLSKAGLVGLDRVMILRAASNFDQQYPGQSALESIHADNGGYRAALENAYRAGSAVTRFMIKNWAKWNAGVPPLEAQSQSD
ncbi:MAG: purine nucleoside permease [Acidobacteriota bacterium]